MSQRGGSDGFALRGMRRLCMGTLLAIVPGSNDAAPVALGDAVPGGVFSVIVSATDGHVVRTLIANQPVPAAGRPAIIVDWDQRDDAGNRVPAGSYIVTRVANRIRFTWEGTLANTSRDAAKGGDHVFRSYEPLRQIAVDAQGNAFAVVGYNEQQPQFFRFSMSDPKVPSPYLFDDFTRTFASVASDGELVYYANVGTAGGLNCSGAGNQGTRTFIAATEVSDNRLYRWEGNAERIGGGPGAAGLWYGVDVETNAASPDCHTADNLDHPARWRRAANGGLAVQRRGTELFSAHTDEDAVHVLDKRSGHLDATISVRAPASICSAADDSLWVLSGSANGPRLLRYTGAGAYWSRSASLDLAWARPLAIACNPADDTLAVVDGATMQVRDIDATGRLRWSLGLSGGYQAGGPDVGDDRFAFLAGYAYIAFLADGSFWLGDALDNRHLHFSTDGREVMDRIAYLPATYRVAVDRDEPERVFAQFLEYRVDYTQAAPLSWTLVRNWRSGMSRDFLPAGPVDTNAGIQRPLLLANGKTYATAFNFARNLNEVVELDPVRGLRPTGVMLPFGTRMYAGGVLRYEGHGDGDCGDPCTVYERPLNGFDGDAVPVWGPPKVIAQVPGRAGVDPVHTTLDANYLNETAIPETRNHRLISFNPARTGGFHLGAALRGGSGWLWRSSPTGPFTTTPGPQGTLDIEGRGGHFPIDNAGLGYAEPMPPLSYAGGSVDAVGNLIVFSYPGEGWNGAEASQFLLYDESGAMLGQFGTPGYPAINRRTAVPGFAGNPYSISLVSADGSTYLYVNDESGNGGIQRWRFDGLDTIERLSVRIEVPEADTGLAEHRR